MAFENLKFAKRMAKMKMHEPTLKKYHGKIMEYINNTCMYCGENFGKSADVVIVEAIEHIIQQHSHELTTDQKNELVRMQIKLNKIWS